MLIWILKSLSYFSALLLRIGFILMYVYHPQPRQEELWLWSPKYPLFPSVLWLVTHQVLLSLHRADENQYSQTLRGWVTPTASHRHKKKPFNFTSICILCLAHSAITFTLLWKKAEPQNPEVKVDIPWIYFTFMLIPPQDSIGLHPLGITQKVWNAY